MRGYTGMIDFKALSLDQQIGVAATVESIRRARQAAYEAMGELPDLKEAYLDCSRAYDNICAMISKEPQPVFDREAHIAAKIEAGDKHYTEAFGRKNLTIDTR